MNPKVYNQLSYLKKVNISINIEQLIQKVVLFHLGLPDMGKLRDRMEGQSYFNKVRIDLLSEYSFEKKIGLSNFDWEKRMSKSYKRKHYTFNDERLTLIPFINNSLPEISTKDIGNYVFVYVHVERRTLVSGLATKKIILENSKIKLLPSGEISEYRELTSFKNLIDFSSVSDLELLCK